MRIESGTGNGREAAVNTENQLVTDAVVNSLQHHVSHVHSKAFQVSTFVNILASKQTLLNITNDSANDMIITYIRLMSIGAAAANSAAFFTLEGGGEYTSGGAALTPVNMNLGQQVVSSANVYSGSTPIVDTGYTEFDRNYEANSMQSYNKDGSVILTRGSSLIATHTGSTAAGVAYARISFYMTGN